MPEAIITHSNDFKWELNFFIKWVDICKALITMQGHNKCSINISNDYYFVSDTMLSPSYSRGTRASCQQHRLELNHLGSMPTSPLMQIISLCLSLSTCKMGTVTVLSSLWSYGWVSELIQRTAQSMLVVLVTFEYVFHSFLPGIFFPALHVTNFLILQDPVERIALRGVPGHC